MKIHLFSFTKAGSTLATRLATIYQAHSHNAAAYTMKQFANPPTLISYPESVKAQVGLSFDSQDALVFIGACGIAVRMIAPYIRSKTTDPCVLVIDEKGQYVISLLSGHIGGGNDFALETAQLINATPIISTATDLNHKFAVDNFAKKNHLTIDHMPLAKAISATLLQNEPVGIQSALPLPDVLPDGLIACGTHQEALSHTNPGSNSLSLGILIDYKETTQLPFEKTLKLYPKQVVLGIGCKKNTPLEAIEQMVLETLKVHHIALPSISQVASIDLKKDEPGLIAFCEKYQLPLTTYSADELKAVEGSISRSKFVSQITGVDTVCERAALAVTKTKKLLIPKTAGNGVTVAASLLPFTLNFEL